jgi:hypothetical protein
MFGKNNIFLWCFSHWLYINNFYLLRSLSIRNLKINVDFPAASLQSGLKIKGTYGGRCGFSD